MYSSGRGRTSGAGGPGFNASARPFVPGAGFDAAGGGGGGYDASSMPHDMYTMGFGMSHHHHHHHHHHHQHHFGSRGGYGGGGYGGGGGGYGGGAGAMPVVVPPQPLNLPPSIAAAGGCIELYDAEVKAQIPIPINALYQTVGGQQAVQMQQIHPRIANPQPGPGSSGSAGNTKTKVCTAFATSGSCRANEGCRDVHVEPNALQESRARVHQWIHDKESEFDSNLEADYKVFYSDLKEVISVPKSALSFTRGLFLDPSDREKRPGNHGGQHRSNPTIAQQAPTACGLFAQNPQSCKWGKFCNQAHVQTSWIEDHRRQFEDWSRQLEEQFNRLPDTTTFNVHDPIRRVMHTVPKQHIAQFTRGLLQSTSDKCPSVCLLALNGRCTAGPRCNQAHVHQDYLTELQNNLQATQQQQQHLPPSGVAPHQGYRGGGVVEGMPVAHQHQQGTGSATATPPPQHYQQHIPAPQQSHQFRQQQPQQPQQHYHQHQHQQPSYDHDATPQLEPASSGTVQDDLEPSADDERQQQQQQQQQEEATSYYSTHQHNPYTPPSHGAAEMPPVGGMLPPNHNPSQQHQQQAATGGATTKFSGRQRFSPMVGGLATTVATPPDAGGSTGSNLVLSPIRAPTREAAPPYNNNNSGGGNPQPGSVGGTPANAFGYSAFRTPDAAGLYQQPGLPDFSNPGQYPPTPLAGSARPAGQSFNFAQGTGSMSPFLRSTTTNQYMQVSATGFEEVVGRGVASSSSMGGPPGSSQADGMSALPPPAYSGDQSTMGSSLTGPPTIMTKDRVSAPSTPIAAGQSRPPNHRNAPPNPRYSPNAMKCQLRPAGPPKEE